MHNIWISLSNSLLKLHKVRNLSMIFHGAMAPVAHSEPGARRWPCRLCPATPHLVWMGQAMLSIPKAVPAPWHHGAVKIVKGRLLSVCKSYWVYGENEEFFNGRSNHHLVRDFVKKDQMVNHLPVNLHPSLPVLFVFKRSSMSAGKPSLKGFPFNMFKISQQNKMSRDQNLPNIEPVCKHRKTLEKMWKTKGKPSENACARLPSGCRTRIGAASDGPPKPGFWVIPVDEHSYRTWMKMAHVRPCSSMIYSNLDWCLDCCRGPSETRAGRDFMAAQHGRASFTCLERAT